MSRLRNIIKEALSTPPKKENIDCCCNSKKINTKGTTLNENIDKRIVMTENMQYHMQNQLPLTENTFRYGSKSFLDLWSEARYLYVRNAINVNELDQEILTETNLGEYGILEGEKVPLDLPISENEEIDNTLKVIDDESSSHEEKTNAMRYIIELAHEISGIFPKTLKQALEILGYTYSLNEYSAEGENWDEDELEYYDEETGEHVRVYVTTGDTVLSPKGTRKGKVVKRLKDRAEINFDGKIIQAFYDKLDPVFDPKDMFKITHFQMVQESILNEAKKKNTKKLNKPMRDSSGGKAYKVYVKDPKTKKIKTVRFGSGGLRAKINDKKARNAFAARHKCSQKKDKTKAGYWSCRLPRYAKLLGLKSSFSGFW